jgi:hypothetical protein
MTAPKPATREANAMDVSWEQARPCQPSPGAFRAQLITMAGSGTISL